MKNNKLSVKELCEFIWYLEDKYNLLYLEIDGVKVWQYIRMDIYYLLAQKTGVLEKQNVSQNSFSVLYKNMVYLLKNSLFNNPFSINKKIENVIFTHNRSKKVDDENIDIYTKYFIDTLEDKNYISIEKPFQGNHIREKDSHTYYSDAILTTSILYGKIYKIKDKDKYETINNIQEEIEEKLKIKINLLAIFKKNIARFKVGYKAYSYIFSKIKPKRVYVVVGYAYMGDMIKAAKDLGIETIEFQHGVISKYHLGYSFPNKQNLEYFADTFYSWGNFWNKIVENSFDKIQNNGFTYFRNNQSKYKEIKKIDNKIVVISQTALGNQIMKETLNIINSLNEYQIFYKLHPEEFLKYKNYASYEELNSYDNIVFVEKDDLYLHLAESMYQIGVFSTALYEGIAFGCNTYLYNLPGMEYMEDLLESKNALMICKDTPLTPLPKVKVKFF